MGCWNTNLVLCLGFFGARGDNSKAFPAGLLDTPLAPLQPVLMHLAHYWCKQRKSNPLCCCWNLSYWLSACSGIDWLWFVISKIFIGSIYSTTRVCPCATPLCCAHQECPQEQAQPLDWKHSKRKGGWMSSRLLHGIKWKAGKGTSWEQLCLGNEERWSTFHLSNPVPSPSFPKPGYSQVCLFQLSTWFHKGISTLHQCPRVTWNCTS